MKEVNLEARFLKYKNSDTNQSEADSNIIIHKWQNSLAIILDSQVNLLSSPKYAGSWVHDKL